jgi:hypothetical protein
VTAGEFIERLLEQGDPESLRTVLRLDPTNPVAIERLAVRR